MAICAVALKTGAHYEFHHHAPEYLAAGGSPMHLDQLKRAIADNDGASLEGDEALVVRYAIQMTRDVTVDDALFAQVATRFRTTELVELTATIATYNMVARLLVALHCPES